MHTNTSSKSGEQSPCGDSTVTGGEDQDSQQSEIEATICASPSSSSSSPPYASGEPISLVPPPWTLRGDIYTVSFWTSKAKAESIPKDFLYPPLEAQSRFADDETHKPVGGLGLIQVLRYTESPVGPYDEMVVVPGYFEWTRREPNGKMKTSKNMRITKIYVSQKDTCSNGRLNWHVPKHLAKFDWHHAPDGTTTVKVFPHDDSGDARESCPSPEPFFQAAFKPARFTPSFPFATLWLKYLGFNMNVVQPPLPAGAGGRGELPGADGWCSFTPDQYSPRTSLVWADMSQQRDEGSGGKVGANENFWPGMGRWQVGMKMEDAVSRFDCPLETWGEAGSAQVPSKL